MASVSALATSVAGAAGVTSYPRPFGRPGGGAIDTAAAVLGLSRDDVINGLKQGKSLDDLAEVQGVSHEDLVSALRANMPAELASGGQSDQIAERIATQRGLPGTRREQEQPPAPAPVSDGSTGVLGSSLTPAQQKTLDRLSNLLGTDSESLIEQLRSGTSLASLTTAAGVNTASLASILEDGLLLDTRV